MEGISGVKSQGITKAALTRERIWEALEEMKAQKAENNINSLTALGYDSNSALDTDNNGNPDDDNNAAE